MKFLYFTRDNGDIDSRPDNPKLDTAEKKRNEIGDNSSRFSVQNPVNYPLWDGDKYISNLITIKEQKKLKLKQERNQALENITVEVNGKVFQSRRSDEMNFRLVLASMEDGDTEEWILNDDSIVEVTKAELAQAYMLGLAEGKRIFSDYKESIKNL